MTVNCGRLLLRAKQGAVWACIARRMLLCHWMPGCFSWGMKVCGRLPVVRLLRGGGGICGC